MRWATFFFTIVMLLGAVPASATAPGTPEFQRNWDRTDRPVQADRISRTWMWGRKPTQA
ncbi:MAG TPA: hypothetical protein VFV93_03800 [Thermomicrobiales bacterium]|nr:hypothetical protein [Thermomicrobiales bacterium]